MNAKFVGLKELYLNYNEVEDMKSIINIPFKDLKKINVYGMSKGKNNEEKENIINEFKNLFKNTKVKNNWL